MSVEHHICQKEFQITSMAKDIDALDARVVVTEKELNNGNSRFVRLEGKLESVSEKLGELSDTIKGAVRWVLVSIGTVAIGAIIYVIRIMPVQP